MDSEGRPMLSTETSSRSSRSWIASVLSIYLLFLYAAFLVMTLVSLGFFAVTDNTVRSYADKNNTAGYCVLYANYINGDFELGKNAACAFILYGEGVLAFISLLLVLLSLFKAILGRWLSGLLIVEFVLLFFALLLALALAVNVSIGFEHTCQQQGHISHMNKTKLCIDYTLPNTDYKYAINLHIVEIGSWLGFGVVFFCAVLELIFSLIALICIKHKRSKSYHGYNDWLDKSALSRNPLH